jgi:hypothetical protein
MYTHWSDCKSHYLSLLLLLQGNESQKVSPKIQDALVQLETNLKGEIQGIKSVASNKQCGQSHLDCETYIIQLYRR